MSRFLATRLPKLFVRDRWEAHTRTLTLVDPRERFKSVHSVRGDPPSKMAPLRTPRPSRSPHGRENTIGFSPVGRAWKILDLGSTFPFTQSSFREGPS